MKRFWMVHVFGTPGPNKHYKTRALAEGDAKFLCRKESKSVAVLEVVQVVRPQIEIIEETDFETDEV